LHPLVRVIEVDREPAAMISTIDGVIELAAATKGKGGVLVDHRIDPGLLAPLTSGELAFCRAVRPGAALPRTVRAWLEKRGLLVRPT
jgi:hypothetical protein